MARIALFPGSFDPFTNGHLDTVVRASQLFDEVVIAAMTNTAKKALFAPDEKVTLIEAATAHLDNVRVVAQANGLTIDLAHKLDAHFIVRGLRNANDLAYESDIARVNQSLDASIETVFLLASSQYLAVSSSMIKEVAQFGGDVSTLVPMNVAQALQAKFAEAQHD
ncbi:pantetheine-phosphate adenylyltransferase [Lacticaseibacillus brantae DSM 23927]|uniref:Phosphopantetheine adenylyltransferase n=2 Tax=Lacticaseibacillus brantae TaxID=943673 RepID=A0A0R2AZI5_9LACO|nr:pantetheine-phosphate adenylyltransferase [Lacticaseibacillus brantae DSM 23927]